jgi:hypothetical protein
MDLVMVWSEFYADGRMVFGHEDFELHGHDHRV